MPTPVETDFPLAPALKAMLNDVFDGYYGWTGARLLGLEAGRSRVAFTPRPEMLAPRGTLNGALMNGILELPSVLALMTALDPGELLVTNDFFMQHIRPLPGDGEYILEGRLIRRGKTMAWTEATASIHGKVTTLARITKTILPP